MIDLNEVKKLAWVTAQQRSNIENMKSDTLSMLKHCATEVVEATEANTRWEAEKNLALAKQHKEHFAEELADIITCVLIIAKNEDIDIEEAIIKVQVKNQKRVLEKM